MSTRGAFGCRALILALGVLLPVPMKKCPAPIYDHRRWVRMGRHAAVTREMWSEEVAGRLSGGLEVPTGWRFTPSQESRFIRSVC